MTVKPRVFVSYSTKDSEFVQKMILDLRAAGIDVWFDAWELQPAEPLVATIVERGLGSADTFFTYLTQNALDSEWCREELQRALERRGAGELFNLVVLADSQDTLDALPDKAIQEQRCEVLTDMKDYPVVLGRLISTAWQSLQKNGRLRDASDHIHCDVNIVRSPYARVNFMKDVKKELIVAGPNLRGWLNDDGAKQSLVDLVSSDAKPKLTMILGTLEALNALTDGAGEGAGEVHLKQSVKDLEWIRSKLDEEQRKRFGVYFHFGAVSMSAVIRDPYEDNGVLVFTPRWGIDYQPLRRVFCVVEKKRQPSQFQAIADSTFNLIQPDALNLDQMLRITGVAADD